MTTRQLLLIVATATMMAAQPATAQENRPRGSFTDVGTALEIRPDTRFELSGYFRARGEALHNFDLNHGLTPSGQPLHPVPLSGGNTFTHGDLRLRTDLAAYSPVGAAAVRARVDVVDNLGFGSTPDGPPQTTISQRPLQTLAIRRVHAEVLTPVGFLMVGRMGSHWGLGMLTHSGDGLDSDSGDAADRVAFITPLAGHIWAVAYDHAWSGPQTTRRDGTRTLDLDPTDDVRALTFAAMRYRTDSSIARRRAAGLTTVDYGAYYSTRWQRNDVPAHYVPTASPPPLTPEQVVYRGLRAHAVDGWLRLHFPFARVEAELAVLTATIDQASLLPGVGFTEPLSSLQIGGALETEFGAPEWPVTFGLDSGFASGDPTPGFGAFPGPYDDPGQPGDLDGPQANPPRDNRADNFRFHPDYRVDRILFREIIGTVTDAVYVRPHVTWHVGSWGPGLLRASFAAIGSSALYETSTPGQTRPLGVELNPTLEYESYGHFFVALQHGVLFPLSGLDNVTEGTSAQPAQMLRLRLAVEF